MQKKLLTGVNTKSLRSDGRCLVHKPQRHKTLGRAKSNAVCHYRRNINLTENGRLANGKIFVISFTNGFKLHYVTTSSKSSKSKERRILAT